LENKFTSRYATLVTLLAAFLFQISCAGLVPSPKYRRQRPDLTKMEISTPPTSQPEQAPLPATISESSDLLDRAIKIWWGTPYQLGVESVQQTRPVISNIMPEQDEC